MSIAAVDTEVQTLRIQIIFLMVLGQLAIAGAGLGRDILVPNDADSLPEALELANPGARILLPAGRHAGANLDLIDRITILGDPDAPETVIIDGDALGRVFRAESITSATVVGVTIAAGDAKGSTSYDTSGGGILVSNAALVLRQVRIVGNLAAYSGGALRVSHGELDVEDCVFTGNRASKGGGAVDLSYDSTAEFTRCTFRDNSAAWGGAISARTNSSCWFYDCVFTGNTVVQPQELGGAFFADFASTVVFNGCVLAANAARQGGAARITGAQSAFVNCTIDGNAAWESGGGFMVRGGHLYVDHSIVSFNHGTALSGADGTLQFTNSDIFGNLAGDWVGDLAPMRDRDGNLSVDPLYCVTNPYYLQDESPCAEANSPVGLIGALPAGCDDVGIVLQDFEATVVRDEVHLRWYVTDGAGYEFRMWGRPHADPDGAPWEVACVADPAPGHFRAVDKPAADLTAVEYRLEGRLGAGEWFFLGELLVDDLNGSLGGGLQLGTIFPNPFNPQVSIEFTLGEAAPVLAQVYDVHGRLVRTLANEILAAGAHAVTWDSRDETGRPQSTGTYLLRLTSGGSERTSKLLLVK